MQKTVFITGNSSGLGYALSEQYLSDGWQVYGLSRRGCQGLGHGLHDIKCDLLNLKSIEPALSDLLSGLSQLDVVYLNAGFLGKLNKITDISHEQFAQVMNINTWANKVILDWLLTGNIQIKQIIAISTGTGVSTSKGWGAYSLSKLALNKLLALYADEFPDTHFTALAPGLVDTAMQAYLCDENRVSVDDFPSIQKMRDAKETNNMPSAQDAAHAIINAVPRLMEIPSGSYTDMRNL
jgi:NAD(P)-dependent dehydrogenase (short-subunit alcohol dehydrogenase family)